MKNVILVAIDGSNNSIEALKEAVKLARLFDCKITIVNVQPSLHTIHTRFFISDEMIMDFQQEQFEDGIRVAVNYLGAEKMDYEAILRVGDPAQQICKLAKELNSLYIVLGSRGLGLIRSTVLGSVSTGVLHEAQQPILIIPEKHKK